MSVFLLIISILLWVASLGALVTRPLFAPLMSYLALLALSFCTSSTGEQWVPINGTMLISWLCITIVVMMTTVLQPAAIRRQARGMAYIIGGALTGMVVGLLGFTISSAVSVLYGIMIVATAAGIFLGFLLYSKTPSGEGVGVLSGNFFNYLMAKGFPAAVTVMQVGLVFVLLIYQANFTGSAI